MLSKAPSTRVSRERESVRPLPFGSEQPHGPKSIPGPLPALSDPRTGPVPRRNASVAASCGRFVVYPIDNPLPSLRVHALAPPPARRPSSRQPHLPPH